LVRKLLHINKLLNLTPLTQLAERNACNLCGPRVCTLPRTSFQVLYHFFPFGMIREEVIRDDESAAKVLHQLQSIHHRLLHFVNGSPVFVLHIGFRLLCHPISLPSKRETEPQLHSATRPLRRRLGGPCRVFYRSLSAPWQPQDTIGYSVCQAVYRPMILLSFSQEVGWGGGSCVSEVV